MLIFSSDIICASLEMLTAHLSDSYACQFAERKATFSFAFSEAPSKSIAKRTTSPRESESITT